MLPGPSGDELTNDMTAGMMNQKKYPRFTLICVANTCLGTVTNMSQMMFESHRASFLACWCVRFAVEISTSMPILK